jgi:hypothetical protein
LGSIVPLQVPASGTRFQKVPKDVQHYGLLTHQATNVSGDVQPSLPKTITTIELADRLERHKFFGTVCSIPRDLEKLREDCLLLVDEANRPFEWSFYCEATVGIIPASDLPATFICEIVPIDLK